MKKKDFKILLVDDEPDIIEIIRFNVNIIVFKANKSKTL